MSPKELWALAEMDEKAPKRVSFELMSKSTELAPALDAVPVAVVIGGDESAARAMAEYGAARAYVAQDDRLATHFASPIADTLAALIEQHKPAAVFIAATALGKDIIARVAARLKLGMLADCIDVKVEKDALVATEAAFGGGLLVQCACHGPDPHLLSFRPNALTPVKKPSASPEIIESSVVLNEKTAVRLVERVSAAGKAVSLEEASVIVAGGRGLGAADKFALLDELAAALGGALAASRAAVDAGWRPYAEQVGQTGKTVKPSVYIACAISGAIQHKVGMQTAEHIIAINKDADAPIFAFADLCVVGDAAQIVPLLTEEIKKRKGG